MPHGLCSHVNTNQLYKKQTALSYQGESIAYMHLVNVIKLQTNRYMIHLYVVAVNNEN